MNYNNDNASISNVDKLLDLYLRLPEDKRMELFNDIKSLAEENLRNSSNTTE